MLSGFVIAHAYGERLANAAQRREFVRDRIIRLHPMLVLSAIVGAVVLTAQVRGGVRPPLVRPMLDMTVAPIPLPAVWETWLKPFPINFTQWSLFWELSVNLGFALIASRLSLR